MPVDFTGVLIALVIWIGGTVWAYGRIRAAMLARHDAALHGPLPAVRPVFWTTWASIVLAVVCFFLAWGYDRIRNLA